MRCSRRTGRSHTLRLRDGLSRSSDHIKWRPARRPRTEASSRRRDWGLTRKGPLRKPVLAQVLPDVLDRIELGGARGQEDEGDGAAPYTGRGLDEVELHRLAVGVGHSERRAGAARRADGTEQV